MSATKTLVLIDGHALIYRAYHAFFELSTHEGVLVNAVYGFTRILLSTLREYQPEYVAVTFDHPKPTFRHQQFTEYKAHRAEMPDDLKPQIAIVKDVVKALGIPIFELEGYEADDLIGTIAAQASQEPDVCTVIVTGDRDAFQLVNDKVTVLMPGRGKDNGSQEFNRAAVKTKMGVWPEQIIDLKALMGDASDNIPGVPGIGEKTAVKLLETWPVWSELWTAVDKVASGEAGADLKDSPLKGAVGKKMAAGKDSAELSRQLATINTQVPIKLELDACQIHHYDKAAAVKILQDLEFRSLISALPPDEFELGVQAALF